MHGPECARDPSASSTTTRITTTTTNTTPLPAPPDIARAHATKPPWSVAGTDIMGNSPRSRTRQSSGSVGKALLRGARDLDSRRLTRTTTASLLACSSTAAKPPSPPASTLSPDPEGVPKEDARPHDDANSHEDIAPEIVVWTEDMDEMMVDSPESATPTTPSAGPDTPEVEAKITYVFCTLWLFIVHSSPGPPWPACLVGMVMVIPHPPPLIHRARPSHGIY